MLNPANSAGETGHPGGLTSLVIVRSTNENDATARLHSAPILFGARAMPGLSASLYNPEQSAHLDIGQPACLVFHYNDVAAVAAIRAFVQRDAARRRLVVCLGSDIYDYSRYTALHDIVDLYVMPTDLHRDILASQVYKPVYTLEECIDPVAIAPGGPADFPIRHGRRVLWFGYAESFDKSMSSLMPVIIDNLAGGAIDGFEIIVNLNKFLNRFGLTTIPYDIKTFHAEARQFDYAILSHFSLDLALNSYIKSPNKLVTALISGIIPIASDTPSYRALLTAHGLERFLFGSPMELDSMLQRLDPVADSRAIQESGIVASLLAAHSQDRVFDQFLSILRQHADRGQPRLADLAPVVMAEKRIAFRDHLLDLAPSFWRMVKPRARALFKSRR